MKNRLWSPLRARGFRNLLLADVLSDVGTFMQSVGAAWFMVSFGAGPMYVALTQTASALPFFMIALPAGSIGDIVDRRKLILWTELAMAVMAAVLAALTIAGIMTPWLLLVFTFAISAGDALETPAWRALLPDLVPRSELAPASALSGIEFNLARAVGPALGGGLIALAGVGAAFAVNAASFVAVIWSVARWKQAPASRVAPAESIGGATVAALRYVRHSPAVRALTARTGGAMFFGSAVLALLPTIAKRAGGSSLGYGWLLGCFGAGAVAGAVLTQRARDRWSSDAVVSISIAILGAAAAVTSVTHSLGVLAALMLVAGGAWLAFISQFSGLVQSMAPDWVRARVVSIFMLVFQGALAAGSALWGFVAEHAGVPTALVCAAVGCIAAAALGYRRPLPAAPEDLSPWDHWRMPAVVRDLHLALDDGPVLVTVAYEVSPRSAGAFTRAMLDYEHVRRRDGASRWGLYRDTELATRYLETFVVGSWAEHLRQHVRLTKADRAVADRIRSLIDGEPDIQHFIDARQRTNVLPEFMHH